MLFFYIVYGSKNKITEQKNIIPEYLRKNGLGGNSWYQN